VSTTRKRIPQYTCFVTLVANTERTSDLFNSGRELGSLQPLSF
jgi:hypothetical protein